MPKLLKLHLADDATTEAYGMELASHVDKKKQTTLYFQGEIGAGKTTLIRSMLRCLGVKERIKSPTFSVMESYFCDSAEDEKSQKHPEKQFPVYHFDLYRLTDPEELEYLGWRDCFSGPSLCCVEWPERAKGYLPEPDFWITLKILELGRELTVKFLESVI